MADDGVVARPVARPVRTAVTERLDARESCGLEQTNLRMAARPQSAVVSPQRQGHSLVARKDPTHCCNATPKEWKDSSKKKNQETGEKGVEGERGRGQDDADECR